MTLVDPCPRCGGWLNTIKTMTSVTWRAKCVQCGRYSHLDGEFRWVPGYGWGAYAIGLGIIIFFLVVSYLENNGWA